MHFFIAADLGGLLGLYLGGSAISLFEIIDLIVYNFAIQIRHRTVIARQRKKMKAQANAESTNTRTVPPLPPPLPATTTQSNYMQDYFNKQFEENDFVTTII